MTRLRPWHAALLLAVGYYIGARLGFAMTFQPQPVSTLWFPNAILLAAFILAAPRTWWLLLMAAFVAHVAVELPAGVPLPMTLCWFISNSAEGVIGAVIVRRFTRPPFALDRVAHVALFVTAALAAIVISSFLDAGFVKLNGWGGSSYWSVWRTRLFSNTLAALTVAPLVLGVASLGTDAVRRASRARWVEAAILAVAVIAISTLVFGGQTVGADTLPALMYAPLPFLLWAAVRFGPGGASAAVMVTVLIATWNAVHGRGPFVSVSASQNALEIQLLFSMVAITQLSLVAVLEEMRRAQASAWRNGEQLRLALDAAQVVTWDWPVGTGHRVTADTRVDRTLAIESLLGRIHPSDRFMVADAFSRSIHDRARLDIEFRIAQPQGDVRWVHSKGKVLRDEAGRPIRVVGISADVTERRLAEALNAGETRILGMIASGAPLRDILTSLVILVESESLGLICSILLLDADGVHASHAAAPSLPAAFVHAVDGFAIGPDAGSCGAAMYLRQSVVSPDIREDPRWDGYREAALRDGLRACWSTPIFSDHGTVLGSFAVYYRYPRSPSPRERELVDIATQLAAIAIDLRNAELEVNQQRRALAHLGRVAVLGELSGTLAHELSQPLTAILSDAQAARRILDRAGAAPDDAFRECIDAIVSADRRAADVIAHVHTLLRKRQARLELVAVNDVAVESLRIVRGDLAAREVRVVTHFHPDLPAIMGDRVQLQQVLLNLSLNACDAMMASPSATRVITITTRISTDCEFVQLIFSDRGTGIPTADLEHVFEPFFTSKDHGLGLGLSICRSIARAHGGRLTATNHADGGAAFMLELPPADSTRARRVASATRDLIGSTSP